MIAYIGIGANLGDARAQVGAALARLAAMPHSRLLRHSASYRTTPIDSSGDDYFNAVACIDTALDAQALLAALHAIELAHGRERPYRNAPRTLDLDLLLFGDGRIASPALTVPHPRLRERAFVLLPLQELAPQRVSAADLAAVAGQRIAPLPPASSPA
jgi:2-amino-4-hydroxy-6-hydroxymethyldihydropteridine diphosphokinase